MQIDSSSYATLSNYIDSHTTWHLWVIVDGCETWNRIWSCSSIKRILLLLTKVLGWARYSPGVVVCYIK